MQAKRGAASAMLAGIVTIGLALLLGIAVCIGAAMDTEMQRRERRYLAEERRCRQNTWWQGRTHSGPLCDRCPYRP